MAAAHGPGIVPQQRLEPRLVPLDAVLGLNGLHAEPVGLAKDLLTELHGVHVAVQNTGMRQLSGADGQGDLIVPRRETGPWDQAEIGAAPSVLRRDTAVRQGPQAVQHPEGGLPDGVVRAGFRQQHHGAALVHAVAGVIVHRDLHQLIKFHVKSRGLRLYPSGLRRTFKQQLQPRLSVACRGGVQRLRQRGQGGIRKQELGLC